VVHDDMLQYQNKSVSVVNHFCCHFLVTEINLSILSTLNHITAIGLNLSIPYDAVY